MDELIARRRPLGTLPTPIERCAKLEDLLGVDELWLKRDDLTGFSWGGNKVRAVEYLLYDALEQGATTMVLAAGPSSNFAAIMAAAGAGAGLAVEQVCYGHPPSTPPTAMRVSLGHGAAMRFTGSDDRSTMERVAAQRAVSLTEDGERPYVIPRGGASAIGSLGFVNAAFELQTQLQDRGLTPSQVAIAVGSGGSIAGLAAGRELLGEDWPLLGVSVSRPASDMTDAIGVHAKACAAAVGVVLDAVAPVPVVDGRGAGFGVASADEVVFAEAVERESGLLIDPVYGAKALHRLAETPTSGPVLYWHTGGALGVVDRLASVGLNDP